MYSAFSVAEIWVPTNFVVDDPGQGQSGGRVNLGGCENVTVSPAALQAVAAVTPEDLRAHWLAQDPVLRRQLAAIYGTQAGSVFLTSGAIGGIRYAFEVFVRPGVHVGLMRPEWPGFLHYTEKHTDWLGAPDAARRRGAQLSYLDKPEFPFLFYPADLIDFVRARSIDFVILSNPSAVTGHLWEPGQVEEVLQACPQTMFVVDEADAIYPELSAAHLVNHYENVLILGSFSKFYGLSGLRIGYAVVPSAHVKHFANMISPAELASVAIRAARESIQDGAFQAHTQQTVRENLARLTAAVATTSWQLAPESRCFAAYLWTPAPTEDPVQYLRERNIDLIAGSVFGIPRGGRLNLAGRESVDVLIDALPRTAAAGELSTV